MEGGCGGGVCVGGLMGLGRVVDRKSGVLHRSWIGPAEKEYASRMGLDSEGVRSLSVSSFTSV